MKLLNFFIIFTFTTILGCSFVPKQKAGSDALAEAICLYDKKIDYKSDDFSRCLANEAR